MKPLSAVGLLALLSSAQAATGDLHWSLSTPMPEPRSDYVAGVVGGKLIVAGGTFWTGTKGHWIRKQFAVSTHAFDLATQKWEKLSDLPVPLACAAGAVVDGRLFVLGGFTGTAVNRKIYVLEAKNSTYAWRVYGDFPFDRVYPRAAAFGSVLYVVGGTIPGPTNLSLMQIYDPVANTWSSGPSKPTPIGSGAGLFIHGAFYAMGGAGTGNVINGNTEAYCP